MPDDATIDALEREATECDTAGRTDRADALRAEAARLRDDRPAAPDAPPAVTAPADAPSGEIVALRRELSFYVRLGRDDRAAAVRAELARLGDTSVTAELAATLAAKPTRPRRRKAGE